ncbi:hypothetical protein [Psychroserpens sp. NJDZ02]|uniref:hypothetical protein n=1 Tax=Psychroserpens sp. NJDZ02 TaxID=2570561 RepID=UPI0010A795F7|nr:hypothetical protein [Psychroserpens sp. NJDZ02]QCE40115.1 hypothetical protein E9099_01315 [Psychroserpens sp. NJDZ02]
MKKFIFKTCIFLFASSLFIVVILLMPKKIIESGDNFKIKQNSNQLVFGHSHPECAYNDSIIQNFENFAQSAESYFYTYSKLKKIVEVNNQVRTVFLEFTNYEIDDDWDKLYTWGDNIISRNYPKYAPVIETSDLLMIAKKNMKEVVSAQSTSFMNNANFIFRSKKNFPKTINWGGYYYLKRDKTDSLLTVLSSENLLKFQQTDKLASTNLTYLLKIIEFCKKSKVQLYLIRSPLHPKYPGLHNESDFINIIDTRLSNVEFLDFKNFPLKNSEFGDLNHLNHKGAKVYSEWFDTMINKKGLLEKQDKQMFIDSEIKARMINVL